MIIQFTGLSGAGKTTLAKGLKVALEKVGLLVEVIDGDAFRKTLCKDLGFSKADRMENIRRLAAFSAKSGQDKIVVIAAINPYEEIRQELSTQYHAKTVWVKCELAQLIQRETKGLYYRAMLPDGHPDKLFNLTGVNDLYEEPIAPDLILETDKQSAEVCIDLLLHFVLDSLGIRP